MALLTTALQRNDNIRVLTELVTTVQLVIIHRQTWKLLIFTLKVTKGFISLKILLMKSFKSVYQKKSLSL